MDVFNPKILDASIRDVALCLTDNQKADLLIYAMQKLTPEGRSRTIIENAVQSCLQISDLPIGHIARARLLRAKARLAAGSLIGAQQDLQVVLMAEPDNVEAKTLLHQWTTTMPREARHIICGPKFSTEIWREIATFLPRRDLKSLLYVPHSLSRVASQLLFRKIDLHFSGWVDADVEGELWSPPGTITGRDQDAWHAQRSADILTRIITDTAFASLVRTLRIFAPKRDRDGTVAFQTGMLANALPKLTNLRNVHCTAGRDGLIPILRVLQHSSPRLRGLSLRSTDGPGELGTLEFKHLTEFSYSATGGSPSQVHNFVAQNRSYLRTICLDNQFWSFPSDAMSIRNLTHIEFFGQFPADSQAFSEILVNGRQLESLSLKCFLDCMPSSQFRSLEATLPFLRHFAFMVFGVNRRIGDPDLFPAIAEFLRDRTELRTMHLTVLDSESVQRAVGFDASVWGVLPSLSNLNCLTISYPRDLAPGLASWLIPRSVRALTLDYAALSTRDPVPFLNQLRTGVPSTLRFIGLTEFPIRNISAVVEQGFPMVRVVRIGSNYWTVVRREDGVVTEMEQWPKRRVRYHASEWLEWLGCEDALWRDHTDFPV
jgi:hypothetical protein